VTVLEGRVEFEVAGQIHRPQVGEELLIPAGAVHSARNVGGGLPPSRLVDLVSLGAGVDPRSPLNPLVTGPSGCSSLGERCYFGSGLPAAGNSLQKPSNTSSPTMP